MAPKIELGPTDFADPGKKFLGVGELQANRADFGDYLRRLTAFDTKYDRVQPGFYAYFSLARGIALFHPDNVHKYIDNINLVKNNQPLARLAVRAWFEGQAEMFSRLEHYRRKAELAGVGEEAAFRAIMALYAAASKVEYLEELVVLGAMEPSVRGLKDFLATVQASDRNRIPTGIEEDAGLTPPEEQSRMKRRWIEFRRDLLRQARIEHPCADHTPASVDPESVLLKVNAHEITLADYLALFGRTGDPRSNVVEKANCTRATLFYAAADFADREGIVPDRVFSKIDASRKLVLAAVQISRDLGPKLAKEEEGASRGVAYVRGLQAYPQVVRVKDLVLEATQGSVVDNGTLFLDRQFVRSVPWHLDRSLAPQHSIHF